MSLKLARGMNQLKSSSTRARAAAFLIVTLTCVAVFTPKGGNSYSKPFISESASVGEGGINKTTEAKGSPVDAERVAAKAASDTPTDGITRTAKIVTCPRCRLNSLPLVKKFVYDHAKHFEPALKVDFILGRDPVLFLYENGKEVAKIDLAVSHSASHHLRAFSHYTRFSNLFSAS